MTVKAIYENGVFRPLEPVAGLVNLQEVELVVGRQGRGGILIPARVTGAAAQQVLRTVAGSLTPDEAELMLRQIEEEFERIEDE
jgi:predicted DNA-binding antitoxin AbrB/MazE fold protein